ncbi:MAG: TRAP transporter small permease subunit [Proteobacteria bacterium]|nr:TRAP transporter small permease subunit [Pseudomonadota bacterium]
MELENNVQRDWVKRLVRFADSIPEFSLGVTVLVTVITIFTQVVSRYVFSRPISWADEFAVLIFAWMIFLGTVMATKYNDHISIDTVTRLLPEKIKVGLTVITNSMIFLVLLLLFIEGIRLTYRTAGLNYPAMEVSRGFLYSAIPVTAPLMGLYLLRTIIADIRFLLEGIGSRK